MEISENDRRRAWEAMNDHCKPSVMSAAVFGEWPSVFGDEIEFILAELYMKAFLEGLKSGRDDIVAFIA